MITWHGVKVGPGPREPKPRNPSQSLKVGPRTPEPPQKFKSRTPGLHHSLIKYFFSE